jgi:predicted Zn-dependent protease
MRHPLQIGLSLLLFACGAMVAAELDIEPRIPPGYQPIDADTEKSIWIELEDYERELRNSALLVKDKEINQYVNNAACRVAGDYCNDLRIYIIRNPYFNASMTANGVLQVWTGLLVRVSSEDELAAILGHELAHYTQLHTLERMRSLKNSMSTGAIFDLGLAVLTRVSVPVGQFAAVLNLLAFSRDQEQEADLLGLRFMAEAGYDPSAAVRVWKTVIDEEKNATVKSLEPGIFSKTHPGSDERVKILESLIQKEYTDIRPDPAGQRKHVDMLNRHYMMLMEDQLDTNRCGRTEAILLTHQAIGVDSNLVNYFRGEMYRQRNLDGDLDKARNSYKLATRGDRPVADAYRNLGYIHLKERRLPEAKHYFRKFLEVQPDADDRAMIEFYLQEQQP